jgi:ABC-type transport system substrate-binding protein
MNIQRAVFVLSGLGLAAALALCPAVVAAQTEAPKLGASLIGKLEGPTIILDVKAYPKTFKEAPTLDPLVKAGKLPPVEQRLPEQSQLLVIKPLHEIGKYGGNWRRAFTGPADHENGNRIVSADKILTFDYTGNKIIPSLARDWKVSEDGKTTTIFLRKGAKWSDGKPLTADDFMFWYQDIYLNKNIVPTPFFEFQINGKDGKMRKVSSPAARPSAPVLPRAAGSRTSAAHTHRRITSSSSCPSTRPRKPPTRRPRSWASTTGSRCLGTAIAGLSTPSCR